MHSVYLHVYMKHVDLNCSMFCCWVKSLNNVCISHLVTNVEYKKSMFTMHMFDTNYKSMLFKLLS